MTFNPVFQAPFSKTFTKTLGGGAWWNLFGAIPNANVVAAYQPKGSVDLAASYINLVTPGTYNAAPGTAPTWDATNGWIFAAVNSQYLDTGVTPDSPTYSIIVRFSDFTPAGTYVFGEYASTVNGKAYIVLPKFTDNNAIFYYGNNLKSTPGQVAGVYCLASSNGYIDGVLKLTSIGTWDVSKVAYSLYIGASRRVGVATGYATVKVQAFAIYNVTLSDTQVSGLTTAMNAL